MGFFKFKNLQFGESIKRNWFNFFFSFYNNNFDIFEGKKFDIGF